MAVLIPHVPTRYDPFTRGRVPSVNMTPAQRWGDLIELTDRNVPVNNVTIPDMVETIRSTLLARDNPSDFILIGGHMVMVLAAAKIFADRHGHCRMLQWSHGDQQYYLVEADL